MTSAKTSELLVGDIPGYYSQISPQKIAIYDDHTSITYRELNEKVEAIASGLHSLGVAAGDVVCAYLPNSIEYVLVVLGVAKLGAIFSPINPRYKSFEIKEILSQGKPRLVFTSKEQASAVSTVISEVGLNETKLVITDSVGPYSLSDLLKSSPQQLPQIDENYYFSLMFTSGTTGKPKGALATHKARMIWVMNAVIQYGLSDRDVYLGTMPQVHSAGLTFTLMHLYVGATVRIMPHFDPASYIEIVENEEISSSLTVPTMLTMIVEALDKQNKTLINSQLKRLVTCGSPLPINTKKRVLEKVSSQLYDYYGSTESNSMTVLRPIDQLRKPTSVGQPFRNVKLKIMNSDGAENDAGEVGEIWCLNPSSMTEYIGRPEDTIKAYTDGWYHTGDFGYIDSEGFLFLSGRMNDVIISGGVNIYPAEIEHVMLLHPKILDAAVVGIPDEKWGQAVKIFLVLKDGVSISLTEIQEHCISQLADFKKPRFFQVMDALPKNAGGKTIKSKLMELENVPN
jgi:acyl-CoA synthetase (AMP-forming)/AMP-acid ligase II